MPFLRGSWFDVSQDAASKFYSRSLPEMCWLSCPFRSMVQAADRRAAEKVATEEAKSTLSREPDFRSQARCLESNQSATAQGPIGSQIVVKTAALNVSAHDFDHSPSFLRQLQHIQKLLDLSIPFLNEAPGQVPVVHTTLCVSYCPSVCFCYCVGDNSAGR